MITQTQVTDFDTIHEIILDSASAYWGIIR